ncbi:hypothetical protein [Chryseobacterium gambrini]|uniref:hypothetical protein n=1 Tax=Chryseobacterium gambrini TaxID=373672 RepID=UPI0022F1AB7C|nr:hypothetical protein [Chryseobacterium gambrini]WBV53239.1 hypothetical protein PFY09_02740 [Chryseobacterium gambrini]
MELYFVIGGFICLVIARNLGTHFYYKIKHRQLLEFLKGKIKNIGIDIEALHSNASRSYKVNKTDVIFFKTHIFLLINGKIFRQAQPILQISRIGNTEKFKDVWEEINYISKMKVENKLRINGFALRGSFKVDYKIFLDFQNKDFDLENYINSQNMHNN